MPRETQLPAGRARASPPRPSGSRSRRTATHALPAARFVRVVQPDAAARAQGLTDERLALDERIGDVLLAAAGVCVHTSGVLERRDGY